MDRDRTGSVRLWEFDAHSAMVLAGFKCFVDEQCGAAYDQVFHVMDHVRKGEFVTKIRSLGYEGPGSLLFDLLDRRALGYLLFRDLGFLGRWRPRPYLFSKPDYEGLRYVKEGLLQVHGRPLLKVWREVLDRNNAMRVSWGEFKSAVNSASTSATPTGLPKTEKELAAVWRAIDEDCAGWISLREWDLHAFQCLTEFKRWADRIHGSAMKCFRVLDANNSGKLSEWELRRATEGPDGYTGDTEALFDCLDVGNSGKLTEDEVKFLDAWDVAAEEWAVAARRSGAQPLSARNLSGSISQKKISTPRLPRCV